MMSRRANPSCKPLIAWIFLCCALSQSALAQDPKGFNFDAAEQGTVIKGEEPAGLSTSGMVTARLRLSSPA